MAAEPEPRPIITKVWARNFRSIEYAELELGPLTVLVGPNASGKSNLLDVLGFLADAARDGLETAVTRRGGIDSIGRKSLGGRVFNPGIGLQYKLTEGMLEYEVSLVRRNNGKYQVRRESAKLEPVDSGDGTIEVELTNGRLTKPNLRGFLKQEESKHYKDGESTGNYVSIVDQLIAGIDTKNLLLMTEEPSLTTMLREILQSQSKSRDSILSVHILSQALFNARRALRDLVLYHTFLGALRYPLMVANMGNLASTLRDLAQKKGRFFSEMKEALVLAVPGVCDIRFKTVGSYYVVEIKHSKSDKTEKGVWFDLSQESDGTIRLLAMLTALFQDPAPSLIGLEEPELAIHPGAMAVLADVMKEASLRGQVVVATHSPDLINLLPIESIRAVTAEDGSTRVGKISEPQMKSLKQKLFSAGELHSMEGLYPVGVE